MKACILALFLSLALSSTAFAGAQDFTLVNATSGPICYVYISASNDNNWGEDVLGEAECLASGDSIEIGFDGSSQAMWDLRVEDGKGGTEVYKGFNLMEVSEITVRGGGKASYK